MDLLNFVYSVILVVQNSMKQDNKLATDMVNNHGGHEEHKVYIILSGS